MKFRLRRGDVAQSSPPNTIRYWIGLLVILVFLVAIFLLRPYIASVAKRLTTPNPVTAAWEKAQAAGSYHLMGDIVQKTIPVANLTNVGRTSHTDAFHLEGQNDLHQQKLELTLWNQGGSILDPASGVSLRSEAGKTFTRRGNEAWQETDNQMDAFAPQGDFLGYLAAVRNVSAGVPETRNGISFSRYTFDLDSHTFAAYMHEQMLTTMRAKGELPAGVQLDPPAYYRNMTGNGELWVGANGLPLRQILNLRFPEQKDERVEASMTVDFAKYGAEQTGLLALLRTGEWQGAWLVLPQRLPDLTGLWLALTLSALTIIVLVYRQRRTVQIAIVAAVIFSQVVGPLLNTLTQVQFFDTQHAKAAAQEEQQAADQSQRDLQTKVSTASEFNPHQNPQKAVVSHQSAVNRGQWENNLQSLVSSPQSAPVTDPGTDTDHDGLTDFTEVRIGTSEVISDTDDDGLSDKLEVDGFTMGGQTWYTNPDAADSNNDGQSDVVEWGIDTTTGLPQATPRDTDSDGMPDLFDPDNDNDGVPDRVDTAPLTKGAATYTEANPLQLTINNLVLDKPTFVDFQIRPQDPKNLWFAYNVLDWPQDTDGQVRDIDSKTYADVAATQGRTPDASDTNGDTKLVPMLEIRIPVASANLPSQAELTPFNISVNDFTADGATKVAYVPLTIVTDPLTGERVAFSGQMRYKPTGSWTVPHNVRLAWVVQALNDIPCDPTAADAAAQGCQSDGYIHNYPSVLQTYYDHWTLTGLGVREENGASMAIVYEDPAVDPNKKDDAPLWALTTGLDQHFMSPQDTNQDSVRDLKLSDFPIRFDRDNNPTEAQRFGIPNILQVVSHTYNTSDEAAIATAMTETVKILDTAFKPSVQADNGIKPLLLFAQENNLRAVGLDQLVGNEGYATQSGANVSFNLAPTTDSALPMMVYATLKWMAYCGADGNNVTWRPCTSDEYASVLEGRYANAPSLPDDTDPAEVPGRMMLALSYYATLAGSYGVQVQEGPAIASSRYHLESDSETATRLRIGFNSIAPLPQIVMQSLIHLMVASGIGGNAPIRDQIKGTLKRLGKTYYDLQLAEAALDTPNLEKSEVTLTKKQIRAIKVPTSASIQLHYARLAAAAPIGSAIMLITTVLSQVPELGVPARAVLGTIAAAVTIGITIYIPAATAAYMYKLKLETRGTNQPKPSLAKILNADMASKGNLRTTFIVGLALSVTLIWGFFIYAASTSGQGAGSPEVNKAAAEAVASTVIAVLLAVLSVTFIGTIIVGLITVIDLLLNLACELGASSLRLQGNFYGGACFSITTTATKVLAYFLYNYEPMIDTGRNNLMVAGAPDVTLADPNKGFVASNTLTIALPVTTTIAHKDPDPSAGLYINGYLWLYSPDNLRSSTFKYGLSQSGSAPQAVDLNQMTSAWQNVMEDHKYVLTPMYSGVANTNPTPLGGFPLAQGINSSVPFSLTMSYAIPAYECWPMWIPGTFIVFPVCRTRAYNSTNTTPFTVLKYDVFPNTLADFVALGPKADGGLGQRWDARIGSLRDVDGDGLNATLFQGLDPDDTTWDADADGLSDRFELEQRAAGNAYSALLRDTDGDGLTDKQEAEISTDPAIADTDNDGLSDGVEVRHQVYDANGKLTNTWAGGWQVTIINTTPSRTIWVSSDPFNADGDEDGISDQAEKALAANPDPALRVDNQGVPYHPNIANESPLAVFTESSALFGYVAPNQSFRYTSTVVANVPVDSGVLNVSAPAVLGGGGPLGVNPATLAFNPFSSSNSQTMTVASNFTVAANTPAQSLALTSTATTRLPDSGGAQWAWTPATTETALNSGGRNSAFINGTALQPDRQDSYNLIGQAIETAGNVFSPGLVTTYDLRNGTSRNLETSSGDWRSNSSPAISCNDLGICLAVWSDKPGGLGGTPPRIGAALLAADGTVLRTFAVTGPATPNDGDSTPVVASDGSNFLVAWQRLDAYNRPLTPPASTTSFQTELMTRLYNRDGNPLTSETLLTGDRLEFYSANIDTTSALNAVRATLNRIDLDWVGDRYRLTRSINLGNATNDPNLRFEDNGVTGNPRLLTWRDINPSGALVAGSKATVYNDANNDANASISLVYNPSTNEVLLVQTRNFSVFSQQFSSPAVTSAGTTLIASTAANAVATYYAPLQGYLIGWTDTSTAARPFRYQVRNSFFQVVGDNQQLTWPVAVNSAVGMALACPAPQSVPTVELRFEELPGTNSFQNAVNLFTPAGCSAGSCPAAGFSGAPNAPRSDYAVQFDGVDDRLSVETTAPGSFSVALWVKAASGANAVLVDQGFNQATGWALLLSNGQPILQIGTGTLLNTTRTVADGAWHFLVATRNGITGDMAIYIDGVLASNRAAAATLLNAAARIYIGRSGSGTVPFQGQMDHFQLYRTVLSANTVQGLYNRTTQSYCVAAAVPTTGTNFPWSRFSLAEQDTRGGRITASAGLRVQVDPTKPTASITSVSNNAVIGADQVIGGTANDVGVGVRLVEVSVNGGPWQTANGANTWSFSLAGLSGTASLRVRATDIVGNVGDPSAAINVTIDNTPPVVTITPPTGTLKPTKNAAGQWQVPLSGTVTDANGVKAGSILVKLTQTSGVGVAQTTQIASGSWNINYLLDPNLFDPTGSYTVTVQADDKVGNRTVATPVLVRLDAAGPVANLSANDTARTAITQTVTIGGVVSDTVASFVSIVGIDKLEIAFTPVDQIAALPGNLTSTEADALLNRTWMPVTLAQRGAGVATTSWSFALPAGQEDIYQIDLRGTDLLGNVSISANLWRGMIDTQNPRVAISATATGASYFDAASNQMLYETRFVCAAVDRNLSEESFTCPGNALQSPVRSFSDYPSLQALFPDLTIRSGLANTYTLWSPTTTPTATASACDSFGHCAQANTPAGVAAATVSAAAVTAAPAPGAPVALVVNPTQGSFVAAGNVLSVTVAAEAGQLLKTVTLSLDNQVVQTLNFAQTDLVTRTLRTVGLGNINEGQHTLAAQATAWDNSSQTTLFPVTFTLDQNAPVVTIDPSTLTLANTWEPGSGVLRFHGNASDSVGLAAVQVREDNHSFIDATFGNGTWRVALPVADPEGRTLNITVRASDRAGRITQTTQAIATELSAADAPDTLISSGPSNPSPINTATFVFTGPVNAVAFDCQLDDGVYTPCASPTSYSDLSKGSHTFRVRAIDSRGLPDLSAAEFTWTVNASQPDVTITTKPANPTTERTAIFAFSGDATATSFECSLDAPSGHPAYTACTSPQTYSNLGNGDHTFQVRARNNANVAGAADRYTWTVVNAAPVTNDQTVTTAQDTAVAITLVAGDEDALTYQVGTPAHGVLVGIPPALTYSPNTGYSGTDSFTFSATDGLTQSNLGTVMIDVQGGQAANQAPVAVDDGLPTTSEIVAQGRITLTTLLANDSDPDDTTPADGACTNCSIVATGQASQGTVTLNGSTVTYVATNPTFRGTDTFTYTLSDNDPRGALTATAQVAVTVQADATPGDCNANGTIDAGDLTALGLEIFDGDGNRWSDAALGSVAFSPYGCDANADAVIDAGDLTCTARRIFDTAFVCGGVVAAQASPASLAVASDLFAQPGDTVDVPIVLTTNGHGVAAAAFSLHWDAAQLQFEATDANVDGTPAAVTFHLPEGLLASATYHAEASRLDLVVMGLAQPLPQLAAGPLVTVRLSVPSESTTASPALSLSTASLGSDTGQSIPLTLTNGTVQTPMQTFQLLLPLVSR